MKKISPSSFCDLSCVNKRAWDASEDTIPEHGTVDDGQEFDGSGEGVNEESKGSLVWEIEVCKKPVKDNSGAGGSES